MLQGPHHDLQHGHRGQHPVPDQGDGAGGGHGGDGRDALHPHEPQPPEEACDRLPGSLPLRQRRSRGSFQRLFPKYAKNSGETLFNIHLLS